MVHRTQTFDATTFVKVRCATDGTQTFLAWKGSIYAWLPGEPKQHLFRIEGMSVGRCVKTEEGWEFASRELTFYLDPQTGEILRRWKNPWTEEMVPVVHVANNFVGGYFRRDVTAEVEGDRATFMFDLFPTYPNPLASDPKFAEYSPQPMYQAAELFKLTVPLADLTNPDVTTVSELHLAWDRIGPWLPWMKMGDRPGHLVYSACGSKVPAFEGLSDVLRSEMETRVPLYKNAPTNVEQDDITSWMYFQKHFDAYLAGATFPIAEQ
jgi:hypothetical protein